MTATPQPRIRVLVVEDHPIMRRGLAGLISPEPDMELVAAVPSGKEALACFHAQQPDVTLMDLGLKGEMTGTQAIQAIRRESPKARIIVITAYKGDEDIFRAIEAGAVTYLLKEEIGDDLISIIRQVHAGGRPVSSAVGRTLAERIQLQVLTPREVEVLQWIAQGKRTKEIAGALSLAEETVHGHIKNILSKLGVHDRSEAITVAVRRGILRIT